jgi:hypothetical protein
MYLTDLCAVVVVVAKIVPEAAYVDARKLSNTTESSNRRS